MVPDLFVITVVNFTKHGEDLYYYVGMLESCITTNPDRLNSLIGCDSQNNRTAVVGSELYGFRQEKYLARFRKTLCAGLD